MQAATAHARYLAVRQFGSLDGIRCLSILAVMWHHSMAYAALSEPLRLLTRGFLGVDLFFVLSGFLITTLLLREEERVGWMSLRGFYRRRILRIVPVYFLVVSLVAGWYILVRGEERYLSILSYYYLFLSNFLIVDIPLLTITWSLAIEEQFYLVWPVLLVLTRRRRAWRLALAVAMILFCLVGAVTDLLPEAPRSAQADWALPFPSYQAILLGVALGLLLHDRQGFAVLFWLFGQPAAPAALLALLLVLLCVLPPGLAGLPQFVVHLAMAALLASVVLREDHVLRPILTLAPVVWIGTVSYGLYLYHLIGLDLSNRFAAAVLPGGIDAVWLSLPVYLAVSFLIAGLSFRYFESYFLALRHRPGGPARFPESR